MFVLFLIAVMIFATIGSAALVLAPRMAEGRLVFDRQPDRPYPFGYRMAWLAIRTRDTQRVIQELGLYTVQPANWNTGLGAVYDAELGETHMFVSPPVNGWTFVVGQSLPQPLGKTFTDKATPLLIELGGQFIEVQYYFCSPEIDFLGWARVIDGKIVRAFAIGDEGVLWNRGKPTREEQSLGLKLFEMRGVRGRRGDAGAEIVLYPTEDHVMHLAGKWGIDPTRVDRVAVEPALGYVGLAPMHWRAERHRKAAA